IDLLEPYALSVFISNLKHEVRQYLQLFKPHNLVDTFHLASQVEDILNTSPKKGFLTSSSSTNRFDSSMRHIAASNRPTPLHPSGAPVTVTIGSSNGSKTSKVPSKGISPALIAERKQNRLCFWCGVKYYTGHKCVKRQLYQLLLESHSDGEGKDFRNVLIS
ncbi:hypothetical protein Gorai_018669, partial [Gossypium raimondii]|nr:hypothetical protein [Gossypium raimondii]